MHIEEKLKLAKTRLLELDRKESLIEESTPSESTTPESTTTENTTTTQESGKIVVFSDVSLERYHKFRGDGELKRSNIYVRLVRGEVIAYEMPSSAHGFVAQELATKLNNWSNQLNVLCGLDITTGNNSEYCADIVAEPRQFPPPGPGYEAQPTIIIEVAKSETLNSLNDLTADYFSASAQTNPTQVYLAIKIFPRRRDLTAAMLAILYLRNNQVPNPAANISPMIAMANTIPNIAISFGTAPLNYQRAAFIINNTGIRNDRLTGFVQRNDIPCTRVGMQDYQITIPANLLFPGGVPIGVPNNFVIDLWEVQQNALYYLG